MKGLDMQQQTTPLTTEINTKYFLQIHRTKIQDYVECGLVMADKYLSDKCEKDLQSKNKNYLVVSEGYIEPLDEEQIFIELIFTDEEKTKLQKIQELYYFDFPLPISRIKKIYTYNKNISKKIVTDIEVLQKGFLPLQLFDVYLKRKNILFEKKAYTPYIGEQTENNFNEKITTFDKRMGMFAYVKNTNIYYANQNNFISNYSNHYFNMFSSLLKEKIIQKDFQELKILNENPKFKELLYADKQIDKDFMQNVYNEIQDNKIKEIFHGFLEVNKIRQTLKTLLEQKEYLYYYIGLVYYFRFKNANRKDNIKQELKELIPYEIAEVALCILGIYLGYKNLRPADEIELEDKYFYKIFQNYHIKFKLETKLDYIMIETIYRYCFYNGDAKKGYEFKYLSYPKKEKTLKIPREKAFKEWYDVKIEKYYDTEYVLIKKFIFSYLIESKMAKYKEEISFSKHYLSVFISKYFKTFIHYSKNGNPCEPYIKTEKIKEHLLQHEDKINQNELLETFKLDKK